MTSENRAHPIPPPYPRRISLAVHNDERKSFGLPNRPYVTTYPGSLLALRIMTCLSAPTYAAQLAIYICNSSQTSLQRRASCGP
ncbi:hypothetical protein ABKN59_006599 [Abortiporus biennis]